MWHICLSLILLEKLSVLHLWVWCAVSFLYLVLLYWGSFLLFLVCWMFYHERVLNFVKCFFCINWDDHAVFSINSVNVVYYLYINQFSYARPSSHSKNSYHLIMVYNPFYMMMNLVYQYFVEDFFLNKFIYFWLCWAFVSVRGLSLVAESGGRSSSRCASLSLSQSLLLRSTGSRRAGSVVVAHGPSCSVAWGILPDQGSNPCPLHWQAGSQPLRHQGSPCWGFLYQCL